MPDSLTRFADSAAVAQHAASVIASSAAEAIAERGRFSLVLSGGSTPKLLYTLLAHDHATTIAWPKVDLFFGDERCVGPDHPDSNYKMAQQTLLAHVPANVHRIPAEFGPRVAADIYAGTLPRTAPLFDIVLLGMGADGHTASLFPGFDFTKNPTALATPATAPAGFAIPDRVSLTLTALGSCRRVLALITGADKAARLAQVFAERRTQTVPLPSTLPMSRVRPEGVDFLVDTAAGAQIA